LTLRLPARQLPRDLRCEIHSHALLQGEKRTAALSLLSIPSDISSDKTRRPDCTTRCLRRPLAASWKALDHLAHRRRLSYLEGTNLHLPANRLHASITTSAICCIDCEDTHTSISNTSNTLLRHCISCRYSSFARLSYPNRPPTSRDQHPLQKATARTTPTANYLNIANRTARDGFEITT
jgi:hypothetical protein